MDKDVYTIELIYRKVESIERDVKILIADKHKREGGKSVIVMISAGVSAIIGLILKLF